MPPPTVISRTPPTSSRVLTIDWRKAGSVRKYW
jgi:hypothetical protein